MLNAIFYVFFNSVKIQYEKNQKRTFFFVLILVTVYHYLNFSYKMKKKIRHTSESCCDQPKGSKLVHLILHKWNEWTTNYNLPIAVVADQSSLHWLIQLKRQWFTKASWQNHQLLWIKQFNAINIRHFPQHTTLIWNTLSDWSKVWCNHDQ